jgi:hypothetical protein
LTIEEVEDVKVNVELDGMDGTDGTGSPEGVRGMLGVEDRAACRVARRKDVDDGGDVDCAFFWHASRKLLRADWKQPTHFKN